LHNSTFTSFAGIGLSTDQLLAVPYTNQQSAVGGANARPRPPLQRNPLNDTFLGRC